VSKFLEVPGIIFDHIEQYTTGKAADQCAMIETVVKIDPSRIEVYEETVPTSEFSED
jgi:hypothetical protein